MEKLNFINSLEQKIRSQCGLIILKPDAVELGIAQDLLDFLNYRMFTKHHAEPVVVEIVANLTPAQIELMYPKSPKHKLETSFKQFSKGLGIVVIYHTLGSNSDMWETLRVLRGEALYFRQELGLERGGLRGIIPVPGTVEIYFKIQNKLAKGEILTSEELAIYHQNLAHTPDDLLEFLGVLNILKDPSPLLEKIQL